MFGRQPFNSQIEIHTMPRYYFNIRRKDGLTKDPAAVELLSVEEAREVAVSYARELLAGDVARGQLLGDDVFEICDERDQVVASIPFKQALGCKMSENLCRSTE